MKRYGVWHPWYSWGQDLARRSVRQVRTLWRQRGIETASGARIAPTVECFGRGRIIIHEGAQIQRGVVLIAEEEATIEIGVQAIIGEHCFLVAKCGQALRIGDRTFLAEHVRLEAAANISIGKAVSINRYTEISPREQQVSGALIIGDDVHVQNHSIIDLSTDVVIGSQVRLGPFCAIYTHDHVHADSDLIWSQGIECAAVHIGKGAWIGQACILLAGVEVGANAVVAAGAVVTHSVSAGTIVGGVPAKVIRASNN